LRAADLDLGAVQPHDQPFGGGVGQRIGQGWRRTPVGVAYPRLANSGVIWRTAAEMVERSTP
jgi:hypothetical protein